MGLVSGDGSTLTDKYLYDEFGGVISSTVETLQPLGWDDGIADARGLMFFGTRY